jgi:hypothetical protein
VDLEREYAAIGGLVLGSWMKEDANKWFQQLPQMLRGQEASDIYQVRTKKRMIAKHEKLGLAICHDGTG